MKRNQPLIPGLLILLFCIHGAAHAANTTKSTETLDPVILEVASNLPSLAEVQKKKKAVESRHPAASGLTPTEGDLSKYMRDFRDEFTAARTGEQINSSLIKLKQAYAAFEKSTEFNDPKNYDFRYFGARVLPLLTMAGYVWRMVPVVEDGKIRASQEALLAYIRSLAEQIKIHAPNSHNEAVFRFLTEPQAGQLTRFTGEKDKSGESKVQDFYRKVVAPAIATSIKRLSKLDLSEHPITFDERMRFGDASFPDSNEKRFRLIGEAEKNALLAHLCRRMASILTFTAYDFSNYLKIRKEMGQKQGIDVLFSGEIGGLTREVKKTILDKYAKPGQANSFGEKKSFGDLAMKNAYHYLYLEASYLSIGYNALSKGEAESDNWLLEPEVAFNRSKQTLDHESIENMLALTAGALSPTAPLTNAAVTIKSSLSGEPLVVNLKAFFYNAPESLLDLEPTGFDHEKAPYLHDKPYCTTCEYRNYFYGRATTWKKEAYDQLFPNLADGKDVAHDMDLLSETRGGRLVANFLAPLVR